MTSAITREKVRPLVNMLEASRWSVGVVSHLPSADELCSGSVTLMLSHHNGHLIRQDQIDAVNGRCFNVHPSLLPLNRGSSPIMWATLRRTLYGVSIHQVNVKIDQGIPISQRILEVDEDLPLDRIYEVHEVAWYEMLHELTSKDSWLEPPKDLAKPPLVEGRGTYNSRAASEQAFRCFSHGWQTIARVAREEYIRSYGLHA
jgi:methionyl-tRNA formyltransferase